MVSLSNDDFRKVVRLLKVLAHASGSKNPGPEDSRKARLLLRKLERKNKAI